MSSVTIEILKDYKVFRFDFKSVAYVTEKDDELSIDLILTDEDYREHGYGTAIINEIKSYCIDNSFKKIKVEIPKQSLDDNTKDHLINFCINREFVLLDDDNLEYIV